MKNKAYYHAYLTDDNAWTHIFMEQMGDMLDSGLMNKLDEFNIICIGNDASIRHMTGLLNYYQSITKTNMTLTFFNKQITDNDLPSISGIPNSNILSETQTLSILREHSLQSEEPYNILYFHAKAVTSIETCLKRGMYGIFINYMHWRKHLNFFVLEKYQDCWDKLANGFDVAGSNFGPWPSKHFSGNFWWAKSDYIKTLPDPQDEKWWSLYKSQHPELYKLADRLVAEMWIGAGEEAKMYSFYNDPEPPPISNLGAKLLLKKEYYK